MNRILIACLVLLSACANVVAPTGGPVDVTPPKVVFSNPSKGQLNVNQSTFELTFDEYVIIKEPSKILLFPGNIKPVSSKISGKTVRIVFTDSIKLIGTSFLQLNGAIADNNASNVLKSFELVFSASNSIDSGNIVGVAKDFISGSAVSNQWVALLDSKSKSLLRLTQPDNSGNFLFDYIGNESLQLIAFEDKNNDQIPQSFEWTSAATSLVKAGDSIALRCNHSANTDTIPIKVYKISDHLTSVKISENFLPKFEVNKLKVKNLTSISKPFFLSEDSLILEFTDTFNFGSPISYEGGSPFKFSYSPTKYSVPKISAAQFKSASSKSSIKSFYIQYDLPISKINSDSLFLIGKDSLKLRSSLSLQDGKLYVELPENSAKLVGLVSRGNGLAFKDFGYSKADTFWFSSPEEVKESSVVFTGDKLNGKILVYFDGKNWKSIKNISSFSIKSGDYRFYLVDDLNGNGLADGFEYSSMKQAEKVFEPKKQVSLKGGWEYSFKLEEFFIGLQ